MEGSEELFNKIADELGKELDWHLDLQQRFQAHPAVLMALKLHTCSCVNRLVREWPHQAEKDKNRLAYTQGDEKGRRNLQTVTTLGRYLTRHFPDMPQVDVTTTVQRYAASGCQIVRTVEEIVNAVQNGPKSCMQFSIYEMEGDLGGHHPYECYDPELGWACAIRKDADGVIVGRALVFEAGDSKVFVRTYQRGGAGAYSGPDPELAAWLDGEGYEHVNGWLEGAPMARIEVGSGILAPYLDGDNHCVEDTGRELFIRCRGDDCQNTGGLLSRGEECEDCEERFDEDDMNTVGRGGESRVCDSCRDENYTYVTGRRDEYYVRNDDAIGVGDEYYDSSNLPDCIVQLHDGDYAHEDDVVRCETDDEYYDRDDGCLIWLDGNAYLDTDDNIVTLENGDYALRSDAWQCYESNDWYLYSDVEPVVVDGEDYHPDHAPETETEDAPVLGYDKPDGSLPNELQVPLVLTQQEEVNA